MDKENYSPSRKARKSLASNWASSGHHSTVSNTGAGPPGSLQMRLGHDSFTRHDSNSSLTAPETPSKSLVGTNDASMLFSPPAILKDTVLPDDSGAGFSADSLSVQHDSNYYTDQSGSISQNSFGSRPLSGIRNRNTSVGLTNSNNGGGSNNGANNCGGKKGSPKSKVS